MRNRKALGQTPLCIALLAALGSAAFAGVVLAQCDEPADEGASVTAEGGRFVRATGVDLVCYPGLFYAPEGRWTFFLRGGDVLKVDRGRLIVGDDEYPMKRLLNPTPSSALIDFEFPPLIVGQTAYLKLEQGGQEIARLPLLVTKGTRIPPERRQTHLVRLQLRPWTLLYPLHGFGRTAGLKSRSLQEIAGDVEFLTVLLDLGIEKIRKVFPRYAEDDSIHWDSRSEREIVYRGDHLRQYIVYLDPDRSEGAFREIFLGFPQVQAAFINEDKSLSK